MWKEPKACDYFHILPTLQAHGKVSAGQPLAQRPDTQDRDAISEAGDGTARVGDWLPSGSTALDVCC